ncbi:hypothetical protein [Devosia sp. MC521]|uniref:hypothetical protein n=1 Tax=Devosia sp. MC521 TaxID=2759954 RepID=UPI0015F7A278|nr:hypothetical protein [Devosia sp. MC521]MBJ6986764.1 hypothetical protein [Devosia sp. MC521]QMW61796.1 hypothetical protein H4N61_12595 [Devosia sp. MC521]
MQKSASPKSKNRRVFTLAGISLLSLAAIAAVTVSGVSPANLAQQADTQIAVFLIPVALLMAVMLYEAARFVMAGPLPARVTAPKRPARRTNWADSDR